MRTIDVLIAEIGSTTTVVNAFDNINEDPVFLGQVLHLLQLQKMM